MPPKLTLIAAVSADGYISPGNGVPWDLPADKQHFRTCTAGKWLLLGRKTYEEMLGWFTDHYPLVLSRDSTYAPPIGEWVSDVPSALSHAEGAGQAELMVLGGSGAYFSAMPYAQELILTHVQDMLHGGAPFPEVSAQDWEPTYRHVHETDALHAQRFEIVTYRRIAQYEKAA